MASKSVQKLAKRYSLDIEYAKAYLQHIQQLSSPNSPGNQAIVQIILRKNTATLPDPEKIAKQIKNEVTRIARNTDSEIISKKHMLKREYWRAQQKLGYAKLFDVERPGPTSREPGIVSHNKLDDERVSRDKLGHCPHGVPLGTICALCNPEEFKKMTGIE
jgi:hypothetical protein